jgi:hypothetical protein
MQNFSIERGGQFSSVSIKSLIEELTPECAANLLDLISQYRKVPLQFREKPFFGYLRHDGEIEPTENVSGLIPGIFCVELVWTIPFRTTVKVNAKTEEDAINHAPACLYDDADRLYDEMTEAFFDFKPEMEHAGVLDAMPVFQKGYSSIRDIVINPEER